MKHLKITSYLIFCLALSCIMAVQAFAMDIFVKTTTGSTITLEVENGDTVELIKQKISDKAGIPVNEIALVFAEIELDDDKTLQYYNIQREATVHMVPINNVTKTDISADTLPNVYALYVAGEHPVTYSVDITWGAMEFNYNANEIWNTTTHKWESCNPTWTSVGESNTVKLSNNSSVAIDATFEFAAETSYSSISGLFTSSSELNGGNKLTMPVANANTAAAEHTVTFTPSGTLASNVTVSTKVGTIAITLS